MKRLLRSIVVAALPTACFLSHLQAADAPPRAIEICVAQGATADVKKCAEDIRAAAAQSPLLVAMGGAAEIVVSEDFLSEKPQIRGFNHIIAVGTPDDPVIKMAWQREARVEDGGLYVFDFGHFRGDIGYLESDRNPFLHSPAIKIAPFETEMVTITGSTPAGVRLATDSFLKSGLINGVVAGTGWKRSQPNLLDHDPLTPGFTLPAFVPAKIGTSVQVGVSQSGETEYRGVLEDTGVKPLEMWRFKYYVPDAWEGSGLSSALLEYLAGLHRRAFGNTLWTARFSTPAEAADAGAKIALAAKLKQQGPVWVGKQPNIWKDENTARLFLWQHQDWVVMSTLASAADDSVLTAGNP